MKIWDIQRNLFRKFSESKDVPFYTSEAVNTLLESLQMIGSGLIEEKGSDGEHFMYSEYWEDKEIIVHGYIAKNQAYERVFAYEIQVYYAAEKPTTIQIGGGYGASGIIFVRKTKLVAMMGETFDKNCISKVVEELKNTVEELIKVYNQN